MQQAAEREAVRLKGQHPTRKPGGAVEVPSKDNCFITAHGLKHGYGGITDQHRSQNAEEPSIKGNSDENVGLQSSHHPRQVAVADNAKTRQPQGNRNSPP